MNSAVPPAGNLNRGQEAEITVWVGAPSLVTRFPSAGRLLVVEAEPKRAQELKQELRERPKAQICQEVLAAETGTMVRWHRFNDVRLSGPIDLGTWQKRYPNLRQSDEEQRLGQNLGELLDSSISRDEGHAPAAIHLMLRQGDPLAALVGLGSWISQLETVQLMLHWPEVTMQLVEAWLMEHHYRQDPQSSAVWNRDPLATRDWLLKEKEIEKQNLLITNHELNKELDKMRTEKILLAEQLKQLSEKLERIKVTKELTEAEIQKSRIENDKLCKQHDAVGEELRLLAQTNSNLFQTLETTKAAEAVKLQALQSLFPMQLYREENSDLACYNEESLLLHYIEHGRQEGRLKSYQEVHFELQTSLKRHEQAEYKLKQLETQFELAQQQLETLKDLFTRIADKRKTQRKDNKE
jgi:hypothetical protein